VHYGCTKEKAFPSDTNSSRSLSINLDYSMSFREIHNSSAGIALLALQKAGGLFNRLPKGLRGKDAPVYRQAMRSVVAVRAYVCMNE